MAPILYLTFYQYPHVCVTYTCNPCNDNLQSLYVINLSLLHFTLFQRSEFFLLISCDRQPTLFFKAGVYSESIFHNCYMGNPNDLKNTMGNFDHMEHYKATLFKACHKHAQF